MTTYTVIRRDGTVIDRHLSAIEAANTVLTYDGYLYEIRPVTGQLEIGQDADGEPIYEERQIEVGDEGAWQCYTSEMSSAGYGGPGRMTAIPATYVLAASEHEAAEKIAAIVIAECGSWRKSPDVMTDEDYGAIAGAP